MAAIADLPVPPAIVASAKPASSSSFDGSKDGFAAELSAAQAQQKKDARADAASDRNADKDADAAADADAAQQTRDVAANTASGKNQTATDNQKAEQAAPVQPKAEPAAPIAELQPQTEDALPVLKQAEDVAALGQAATPAKTATEESNPEEKPEEKKADADPNAVPVAAPLVDVMSAMLPTPVATFGETPKATAGDAGDTAPDLRTSVTEPVAAATNGTTKPETSAAQTASKDGEQASTPGAQAPTIDASANQQQQSSKDDKGGAKDRPRDVQASKSSDKAGEPVIAAIDEAKPVVPQASVQPAQPASHAQAAHHNAQNAIGQLTAAAAANHVNQPQGLQGGSIAVGFKPAADVPPAHDQIAVAISTQAKDGAKNFEIRLDPPELGRVEVKLSIDDAGKTQASVLVEKPHTLELLQRDARNLEQVLKDSGLDLTGNGLNFSLKGQDRQAQQEQNAPTVRAKILNMELTAAETAQAHINAMLPSGSTRLDIRV